MIAFLRCLVPFLLGLSLLAVSPHFATGQEYPDVLTTVADVRNLPRPIAAQELPVRLRAVVTYDNPGLLSSLIVQDATAGIFVALRHFTDVDLVADIPEDLALIPVGTEIEIEGVTGSGDYAPIIRALRVRKTGMAPLPKSIRLTVPEMRTGRYDCQRVVVTGIVQTATRNAQTNQIDFDMETELGSLVFHLEDDPKLDIASLVDAEVTIEGVCLMYFNRRNEQVGTHVHAGSIKQVTIDRSPPPDPFGVPLMEFNRLRPFSPEPRILHRRRISGTVTFIEPKNFLMLQNGDRAVRVNLLEQGENPTVRIGDLVEASGFVEVREFYAELSFALVRKSGAGETIVPQPVDAPRVMGPPNTPAQRLPEDFDGRLVSLSGSLLAVDGRRENRHLLIETDGGVIEGVMPGATTPPLPDGTRAGSTVRVTGVCMVTYTEKVPARAFARPRSFEIRLRTPADITVLTAAPWWTPVRLWIALGIVGGGGLLSSAWVWTLRRRVTQRAKELAEEIEARQSAEVEFEATLRERKRLAADLHDTLEQSLTGLARQLEAADELRVGSPDRSGSHLVLARQLLDRSQEDVRRSVWNLHSTSLELRSLSEALHELVEYRSADQPVSLLVEVQGNERPLPDFISGNLLLLAQEGITNTFKHAAASTIVLRLNFRPESLELSIEDDGKGFLVSNALGPHEGHFGLQGMRERVKRMGGRLTIYSTPGQGTILTAHLRS